MADDWKAWLEFTLLVVVTLLALGRWIFRREHSDENHSEKINSLDQEIKRLRERGHDFGTHLSKINIQVGVLEERVRALADRVAKLEGRRSNSRQQD